MTESKFDFRDPRRLFELWKELTGEDLLNQSDDEQKSKEKATNRN